MFKRLLVVCGGLFALAGGFWGTDVLSDRNYQLTVVSSVSLLAEGPHNYPSVNPTIAILKPGEKVRVLRLRYGKDFQAFRVETETGLVGWVVAGSDVKVMRHG